MKSSLKTKLLAMILAILVVSNFALVVIAYKGSNSAMNKSVATSIQELAKSAASQLYDANETQFNALRVLAALDVFRNPEVSFKERTQAILPVAGTDPERINNVAFYDKDGNAMLPDGRLINFAARDYFKVPMSRGSQCVLGPEWSTVSNTILMWYAFPVYNYDDKPEGVMVTVIKGNQVSRIASQLDLGFGMHPIVINMETGKTVGDGNFETEESLVEELPDLPMNAELERIMAKIQKGETGYGFYSDPTTGKKMVCSYQPVGGDCSWAVFCPVPYDLFFAELKVMNTGLGIGVFVCLVLSAIVGVIVVSMMIKPIASIKDRISDIAEGDADLTKRIKQTSNDELGSLVVSFNGFVEKLQTIISHVMGSKEQLAGAQAELKKSVENTGCAISEILSNIEGVSKLTQNQSEGVEEAASAVNQISHSISSLERLIQNQSSCVTEASAAVEQMIGNINSVGSAVDKMSEEFNQLEVYAREGIEKQSAVNETVRTIANQSAMLQEANAAIAGIASQTNMLAMNAAIEAAHAGDAGKGFSVVADEIRKLSETSSEQSRTIGEELNKISSALESVVSTSQDSEETLNNLSARIQQTDTLVHQVRLAMDEQQEGSKQILAALHTMNESTSEVRGASAEMAEGNKTVIAEMRTLQDSTVVIRDSMREMTAGAKTIHETGSQLSSISREVSDSISKIGDEIDLFKV